MPWPVKITYVSDDGHGTEVMAEPGHTLMSAALRALVPGITALCRGQCTCVTCHVYVDLEWTSKLHEPSVMEESMLDFGIDVTERSRLSCQIPITEALDGIIVHIPAQQRVPGL